MQSAVLNSGSILQNIVGVLPNTEQDAWAAADLAGVGADIRAMPMGMQTIVTDGGSSFSGGQRQRLMIARALLRRPRLLIFDEATSVLDNETQAIVTESLTQLGMLTGSTCLTAGGSWSTAATPSLPLRAARSRAWPSASS